MKDSVLRRMIVAVPSAVIVLVGVAVSYLSLPTIATPNDAVCFVVGLFIAFIATFATVKVLRGESDE